MNLTSLVLPVFLSLIINAEIAYGQENIWLTHYEQSNFNETSRYDETVDFAKKLADYSNHISYASFGRSPQGRDLPLLVADRNGSSNVKEVRKQDKSIILIQACIHAGESDGKDAGLMLLRDMAVYEKYLDLLDHVAILFVPIFNVDGHEQFGPYNRINQNGPKEMGWRTTAQRINLNRDYLKSDSPEMQSMIRLYQTWLPDFYIDCHVTDGADYIYPLTYGLQMHGNLTDEQSVWLKDKYLPFVSIEMKNSGNPIAPYMDFVEWHNPRKGIRAYMETPRYSGGYAAISNRPALLIETHMLKDYKTRVTATYEMLLNSMKLIAKESAYLKAINSRADEHASQLQQKGDKYTLTYEAVLTNNKFTYEGYDYSIERSDLSGGDWYKYSDKPATFEIDYYDWNPAVEIQLPQAYVVPVELEEVIEKLELHNIAMESTKRDTILEIETYKFTDVKWKSKPFEGRIMLDYDVKPLNRKMVFAQGSKIVHLNQRASQIAIHLLEPLAPDALVRWGFLNAIFEQKEYAESYVIEEMAREMLSSDPELLIEFEKLKMEDKDFASNPYAIWNWFYAKTPYWDSSIGIYPIGRIMNK